MTTSPPPPEKQDEQPWVRRIIVWGAIGLGALLLIGLAKYARGEAHHEGDDVGSHGRPVLLLTHRRGENTTTTSTTTEPASTPSSAAVEDLQVVMTRLGYYSGPIDGVYGDATTAAVKEMQKALGVTADGVYGPSTDAALKGKARDVVVQVQTELALYGYYTGPIDGDYGPATQDAITQLQSDLGVTADGKLGPETIDAFNKAVADGTLKPPSGTTTSSTTTSTTTTSATTTTTT
jgi:peptidoglycan hydrolase-like protein with peptidoglycan-binding domain